MNGRPVVETVPAEASPPGRWIATQRVDEPHFTRAYLAYQNHAGFSVSVRWIATAWAAVAVLLGSAVAVFFGRTADPGWCSAWPCRSTPACSPTTP